MRSFATASEKKIFVIIVVSSTSSCTACLILVWWLITIIVAAINLNDGETNAIEGMTHFVLFATFIMLSLIGL